MRKQFDNKFGSQRNRVLADESIPKRQHIIISVKIFAFQRSHYQKITVYNTRGALFLVLETFHFLINMCFFNVTVHLH